MGHHRAFDRLAGEAHGGGLEPGVVGIDFDVIVLGDTPAFRLEPSDALADFVGAFFGAGSGEPFAELGQGLLEALCEALDDGALLVRALLGEAVQAHLLGVLGHDLVQMHALARRGLDALRRLGVEVADAFAADHQIPVAIVAQPLHAVFGGNAAVHDHERFAGGVQRVEHVGQRVVFTHVAGEHLGASHEAARVEHQGQGEQGAIGAFVLGVPVFGLGLQRCRAFEESVGQIIKGDRGVQVEQPHCPVEQVALDGLAVGHQRIGGAIELHGPHGFEVHLQQLAQSAAFAQPAPGGALGARTRHAGDNRADGRRA